MTKPTFVAAASNSSTFASSLTISVSAGASPGRAVFGFAGATGHASGGANFTTVSGVTVNGVSANLSADQTFTGTTIHGKAFWLDGDANVPTGTLSIVVTYADGNSKPGGFAITLSGCGTSPFGTPVFATSLANNTSSWAVTSTTNAVLLACGLTAPNGSTWSATSPAVLGGTLEDANWSGLALYRDGTAGSTTIAGTKGGAAGGWFGMAVSVEGSAAPSDLAGNVTLSDATAAGTMGSSSSDLSGGVTLADATAAGTLGALPGTISLSLANEINVTQASITVPWVSIVRLADAVQVLTVSNQVTNGAGGLSITNGALQQGAWYAVTAWHTDGTKIGAWVKQAT